jgi:hypothetical protein
MNSIKYACSLNNQGVDLLVSGESKRAMTVFQSALNLLKKAIHIAPETGSCTEMNMSCDEASLPFCESTLTVSGLQGPHCYVYDHGIMIHDKVDCHTEETITLYIAIVLFNLALASHSEGTALGQDKSLTKASVLYSLVLRLLSGSCTMPKGPSTAILTVLALNNKAQIHYDQCAYAQSVDCMKEISKIMSCVPEVQSALNDDDVKGLLVNVMLLSTPTAAQAA